MSKNTPLSLNKDYKYYNCYVRELHQTVECIPINMFTIISKNRKVKIDVTSSIR